MALDGMIFEWLLSEIECVLHSGLALGILFKTDYFFRTNIGVLAALHILTTSG